MRLEEPVTLFDGIPAEALSHLFVRFERRQLPDGATLMLEGAQAHEMYVIEHGAADAFVIGPGGEQQHVNRLGPGGLVGEMSMLTGQPASATVIAVGRLALLVIGDAEFERIAAAYPRIYHNIGAILSRKVFQSDRRGLQVGPAMQATLLDSGAPPELGYAIACSVAWHGRGQTLLLDLANPDASITSHGEVEVRAARPEGPFAPEHLPHTVRTFGTSYKHVLVQVPATAPVLPGGKALRLGGVRGTQHGPGYEVRGWVGAEGSIANSDGIVAIPHLIEADEHALQKGSLPPESPAGRRLGWVARDLLGQKIGLALGGGGAKGYAHIGVLSALERAGLPIDFLAGTSVGAAVSTLYALGYRSERLAAALDLVGTVLVRPAVPTRALLSDAALRHLLHEIGGEQRIEDLHPPLAIVAADLASGSEIVFRRGLVWSAVLASIAIPGAYPAQRMGTRVLVDGGVVNPIPRDTVAAMGADIVLAVNLRTRRAAEPVLDTATEPEGRPPAIFEVLASAVEMLQSRVAPRPLGQPTIEIRPAVPDVPGWGLRHFSAGRAYIGLGEAAVHDALPHVTALLPWFAATRT